MSEIAIFRQLWEARRSGRHNPEVMRGNEKILGERFYNARRSVDVLERQYSDEGFSVSTGARDAIVYREGNRKMTISVLDGSGVYEETIGRWDDNPTQKIANEERMRIAENIRRAFESQGLSVYFVERQQQQRS